MFTDCTAIALPADANSYPYILPILVSFCLGDGCTNYKESSEYVAVFSAPVHHLDFYSCVPDEICQNFYNATKESACGCTREAVDDKKLWQGFPFVISSTMPQVADEPYFEKPEIRLIDSAGKLCSSSKISVSAYLRDDENYFCARQFDALGKNALGSATERTVVQARGGIVRFNEIGTSASWECSTEFAIEFIYEIVQLEAQMSAGRFNPGRKIGLVWQHRVSSAVDTLVLMKPVPNLAAGQASNSVIVGVQGRCKTTACGNAKETVERSLRQVSVEVIHVPPTGGSAKNVTLHGTTIVTAIRGQAHFTDIGVPQSGTFYFRFFSLTAVSRVGPLLSNEFKVSSGEGMIFRVASSPGAAADATGGRRHLKGTEKSSIPVHAGIPYCAPIQLELNDAFGNLIDCEFGECPLEAYGYPAQVSSRNWFLRPGSDLRVQADFIQPPEAKPFFYSELTKCQEISGSTSVRGNRGILHFGCISTGIAGKGIRLRFTGPGGIHAITNPFDVIPGEISKLFIMDKENIQTSVVAGKSLATFFVVVTDGCGNKVTTEESQGMRIFLEDRGSRVLYGQTVRTTKDGYTYFDNVNIREVSPGNRYSLRAYVGPLPSAYDETNAIEVVHGPSKTIAIREQPVSAAQGSHIFASVVLLDEFKNIAENAKEFIGVSLIEGDRW